MQIDALTFTQVSYHNMKWYLASKLIEHNKRNKRIRIIKTQE